MVDFSRLGYAEAFLSVQSDLQTSKWYSYFENDVLGTGCMEIYYGIENSFSGLNIGCEKIGLAFWNNVI